MCEKEIMKVLNLLPKYLLTIRIIGGRHSTSLQNPDIFLDISGFNEIILNKYLEVGGGATQGSVNFFLFNISEHYYFPGAKPNHPTSIAFPGGSAATVGVSGISTVGGIGTLRRTLGLTVDSIKSFRIVLLPIETEKSRVVIASAKHQSDLFWALLGGGGANFGVITKITYYPLKIQKVILYEINWKWSQADDVLSIWQRTAPKRPNAFNEDLSLFSDMGIAGINLIGVYLIPKNQTEIQAKETIINEIKPLGGDLIINEATTYAQVYKNFVAARIYHNYSIARTILTANLIPSHIVINRIEKARKINGRAFIGLQLMGGKISDINSKATAFYPRESKFFVDLFSFWDSAVNQQDNQTWNEETFKELYTFIGPYCYFGFPIANLPNHLNAYYGQNKYRLLEIKQKIDPLGLLKFPDSL